MKKKYLFAIVSVLMMVAVFAFTASAETLYKEDIYRYTVTDGEATIMNCSGLANGHVVIPEELGGYPVTAINRYAFRYSNNITAVTIPNTVKRIGADAFSHKIESVFVDDLSFWYDIIFDGFEANPMCQAENFYVGGKLLTELVIPDEITVLKDGVFEGFDTLKSVTIPSGVTYIGSEAFSFSLENIYVESIDFWCNITFEDQTSNPMFYAENFYVGGKLLTDLVIPEGVTAIPDYAFYGNNNIESVTLPKSLQTLGESAFVCGDKLKNIYADSLESWINMYNKTYESGKNIINGIFPRTNNLNYYFGGELLQEYLVIPEGITKISPYTFSYISTVKSVSFPEGFETLDCSFENWNNLEEIYVPDIKVWFNICDNVNKKIETLYINNEAVVNLVIPEDIDEIPDYAFNGYQKLESITITSPLKRFGKYSVSDCVNFKAIYVDSFETWNSCSFNYDNPLDTVEYLYIDGKPVVDLVIPEGTTRINDYVFRNYEALKSVSVPESVEYIGIYAFDSGIEEFYVESMDSWIDLCDKMDDILKGTTLWHPMQYAEKFYVDGELLTNAVISEAVTVIPDYTFYKITSLESLTLNSAAVKASSSAFEYANNIRDLYVADIQTWLNLNSSIKGIFKGYKLKNLYIDGTLLTDYVVPEGTVTLPQNAFAYYEGLKTITFPSSLKSIGKDAFVGCNNIEAIYVPSAKCWLDIDFESVNSNPIYLGAKLYFDGELVENLFLPEGISEIRQFAFTGCRNIKSLTFPSSLKSIGDSAFKNCENIKSVTFKSYVKSIGNRAFAFCDTIENIYAPSIECWLGIAFASADSNPLCAGSNLYIDGVLLENLRVPESISEIKNYAFSDYSRLKKFEITGNPLRIGIGAFNSCSNMQIHVENLEAWFNVNMSNCYLMKYGATLYIGGKIAEEIVVPESIKQIPDAAFAYCKSLKKITIPATTEIGVGPFSDSSVSEIVIGSLTEKIEPVRDIYSSIFYSCESLNKVTLGYGVREIMKNAFANHPMLNSVTLYSGITKIGESAFNNTKITSVVIPSTVESVGKLAFGNCTNLQNVTIGDETNVQPKTFIGYRAFYKCKKLENVTLNSGIKKLDFNVFEATDRFTNLYINDLAAYLSIDGKKECQLLSWPAEFADNIYVNGELLVNLVIPEGVTRICSRAFYQCKTLETVQFPSTLKVIDEYAFASCSKLKNFTLPESLKEIWDGAFMSCNSITSLELKGNIESFGIGTFEHCSSLEKVIIDKSLSYIEEFTFMSCNNLKQILYTGTEQEWKTFVAKSKDVTIKTIPVYYNYNAALLVAPKGLTATSTTDKVILKWSKQDGATGYRVYIMQDGNWKTLKTVTSVTYTVTGLSKSTKYRFAVKSYLNTGALVLWSPGYSEITSTTKSSHKFSDKYTVDKKATVTSDGSMSRHCTREGCNAKASETKISFPKTIKLSYTATTYNGKTKKPTVSVKDSKGKALKTDIDYTVKYASGRKKTGKYSVTVTFKGKYSGKKVLYFYILPSKTSKLTVTSYTTGLKASWSKVTGASGYRVELLNAKGKVLKKTLTTKNSYTFSKLSKVTTYKIRVTAYKTIDKKRKYSTVSKLVTTATAPAQSALSKVKAGSKSAALTWKTVSGASGYEVRYSTSGKFKSAKTATVAKGSSKKTTIKKLTKGKKYYFKIRAYKTVDGKKIYGSWSAVKSAKIK